MQTVLCRQMGAHGTRHSMCRPWKPGTRCDSGRSWQNAVFCGERFGKFRALYVHLANKNVNLFPKGLAVELYSWKPSQVSSCSKRSREITTEPIALLTQNKQSMTVRGFCCYYLEYCSKTNVYHIAINRTKYENLFGRTRSFAQIQLISKFCKDKTVKITRIKNLTSVQVSWLSSRS